MGAGVARLGYVSDQPGDGTASRQRVISRLHPCGHWALRHRLACDLQRLSAP